MARLCSRLLHLLLHLLLVLPLVAAAPEALARPAVEHPRIGGDLAGMLAADARNDRAAYEMRARNGGARFDGDLVEIQLHVAPDLAAETVTDADLRRFGGRVAAHGLDLVDVWLPLRRVPAFLDAHPQVAFAQLPWRGIPTTGPATSQGASHLRGPEVACLAADATGTTVAVIDAGFTDLAKSVAKGEAPYLAGTVSETGGHHGTMCVEVVADVAPGATIAPVLGGSMAVVQGFAKKATTGGNPLSVDVVSHSVIWLGMSFGRHEGYACEVTDLLRAAGIAWVNASGNSGNGQFYTAPYTDADGDGRHDVQPGEPHLVWQQHGGQLHVALDWDDYASRSQNLDLVLHKLDAGKWVPVADSRNKHGKYVPPLEIITIPQAPPGVYGLVVEAAKGKVVPGTQLRVVHLGSGNGPFSVWHKNGNVYDPASCAGVLTVGAVHQSRYTTGPLEAYSSYGPTIDGRLKPEVVAPTGVQTSYGDFHGTSAACPHAAGAVAVYAQATGLSPVAIVDLLLADATAMGLANPDEAYGFGRLELGPASLGWQCTATDGAAEATCTTECGSSGTTTCGAGCRWNACAPPAEACNGADDDCDGSTDEGFGCVAGTKQACALDCGAAGERTCTAACGWGACVASGADCATPDVVEAVDVGVGDVGQAPERGGDGGCQGTRGRPLGGAGLGLLLFAMALALTAPARPRPPPRP